MAAPHESRSGCFLNSWNNTNRKKIFGMLMSCRFNSLESIMLKENCFHTLDIESQA